MPTDDPLTLIQKTYEHLDENLPALCAKCTSADERARLFTLYNGARDTYWKATRERLEDRHALVDDLIAELKDVQRDILRSVKTVQDLASYLDQVAEAVKIGASVVTLAAA